MKKENNVSTIKKTEIDNSIKSEKECSKVARIHNDATIAEQLIALRCGHPELAQDIIIEAEDDEVERT